MSAPPIPYVVRGPGSKTWDAWVGFWEALSDGEWHRGLDLVNAIPGESGLEPASLTQVLARAASAGVLDREVRGAAAGRQWSNPWAGPLRHPNDPWYRRPAGDP